MTQDIKNSLGYIVNGISIAVFIFLGSTIDVSLRYPIFIYMGWILAGFGIFLILISTYTLISNRGKGLIDWGIYSIVRHPMYVGAISLFLSWVFFLPHWLTVLLSLINIAIVYMFILQGDQRNTELFGNEYEEYIKSVPGVNFLAGFFKFLRRR
jgi:protein-S-isoprenylcysteine O-methyltransferase Ste14